MNESRYDYAFIHHVTGKRGHWWHRAPILWRLTGGYNYYWTYVYRPDGGGQRAFRNRLRISLFKRW